MPVRSDENPPLSAQEPAARRRYLRPRLVRFGQLAEITAMFGNMGTDDGGIKNMQKTSA